MASELRGYTPQAEVIGPHRFTHHPLDKGQVREVVYTPRRSRVIMGINAYGDIVFIPLPGREWDKVDPALLPHMFRGAERMFDQHHHTYETARHEKTTTVSNDIGRGDPDFRLPKETGFMFKSTKRDIAKERKDNDLKRWLLKMGIDEHKLYLLLHTAVHNQTLIETERAGKKKKKTKKDYSVSAPFMAYEKKHRRKKKTIARNVYTYRG